MPIVAQRAIEIKKHQHLSLKDEHSVTAAF
jgi:hypothetical protein